MSPAIWADIISNGRGLLGGAQANMLKITHPAKKEATPKGGLLT